MSGCPSRNVHLLVWSNKLRIINVFPSCFCQVVKELIDSIRWGIGFMIAAPVVMFVVQLLTGTNTAGLIAERKEREFQIRILSVLNTLSLAETGQVELATVMSRALAKDVVQDRLKALAVELMTDQAFSAGKTKCFSLAGWKYVRQPSRKGFPSIDRVGVLIGTIP